MLPLFFTSQAEKLFHKRWWFLGASISGMLSIFVSLFAGNAKSHLPLALLMPLVVVSWGLLCMCIWFHPTKGKLYVGSIASQPPTLLQTIIRWYAAVFLVLFMFFGSVSFFVFGLIAKI
jgi:hypothetical protein